MTKFNMSAAKKALQEKGTCCCPACCRAYLSLPLDATPYVDPTDFDMMAFRKWWDMANEAQQRECVMTLHARSKHLWDAIQRLRSIAEGIDT